MSQDIDRLLGQFNANTDTDQILIRILKELILSGGGGLPAILAELQTQTAILTDIDLNTDGIEALLTSQLTELQAINLNTDTLEALITTGNIDLAAIEAELISQSTQLNTIITNLGTINTSIQTADVNNVAELDDIQVQLATMIASLAAIDVNTAPLEASLTAIEAAINTGNLDLAAINTNTANTVTELQTANITLTSILNVFGGTTTITRVDISANPAYAIPASTYKAWQLIVVSGTVTDGTITYPAGVYDEAGFGNKTITPGITLNATGAVAYVKLSA